MNELYVCMYVCISAAMVQFQLFSQIYSYTYMYVCMYCCDWPLHNNICTYAGLIELRKFKIARLYLSNALKNLKADEHAKKLLESLEMDLFLNSGQGSKLHSDYFSLLFFWPNADQRSVQILEFKLVCLYVCLYVFMHLCTCMYVRWVSNFSALQMYVNAIMYPIH